MTEKIPAGGLNDDSRQFGRFAAFVLLLTFFTGAAGLIYEVAWHRYLANLLGSHARAAALVLAVFLGGLAGGYLIFGRLSLRLDRARLIAAAGWAEAGTGLWALVFPYLYQFLWHISGILPDYGAWSIGIDLIAAIALLAPPTVLMGGTLPLLTQALPRNLSDASPVHARIYAINTSGAFIGCLAAGFVLLPALGLRQSLWCAAAINLAAGAVLVLGSKFVNPERPAETVPVDTALPASISPARALAVAFLAGFYAITLQVVFIRLVALSMGSSEYAFSMVVACFILMLALGAWTAAGRTRAIPLWLNQWAAAAGGLVVYLSVEYWPYALHVVRCLFAAVGPAFYAYHALAFLCLCLVLLIPVGAMGATMPLLFAEVRSGMSRLGSDVGRLYGMNTAGCVAGSLVGGYLLFYWFDLDAIYKLSLGLVLLSAVLARRTAPGLPLARRISPSAVLFFAVSLMLVFSLPAWNRRMLVFGLFRQKSANEDTFAGPRRFYQDYLTSSEIIAVKDDPNTTVAVSQRSASRAAKELNEGADVVRNLRVNGKSDGETGRGDTATMRLLGHLPILLNTQPVESAAVVGFGLGVTVGTMAMYPEVRQVDCFEISPAVLDFAHLFDFANYRASKSPKVHLQLGDAYRILGGSNKQYSVIAAEPSNPWVIGVERLYTKEFYELVKRKLRPGGIYAQWMHTYEISRDTWGMVINTFGNSFREVRMFGTGSDIILLGSDQVMAEAAVDAMRRRYNETEFARRALAQVGLASVEAITAAEVWLPKEYFLKYPEQTLEEPKLAFAAGRDFFLGKEVELTAVVREAFARPFVRRRSAGALFGALLGASSDYREVLKAFAKAACEQEEAVLFAGWRADNNPCRHSLAALAVAGAIPAGVEMNDNEVKLLSLLLEGEQRSAAEEQAWSEFTAQMTIEQAQIMINLFRSFDSSFLPLSPRLLVTAASVCRAGTADEAIICRKKLVEALAYAGHGNLSRALLGELLDAAGDRLTDAQKLRLDSITKAAVDAESLLPG